MNFLVIIERDIEALEAGAKNIIKRHLSLEIHIMKLGGRTHKKFFREQKGVPLLFPLE